MTQKLSGIDLDVGDSVYWNEKSVHYNENLETYRGTIVSIGKKYCYVESMNYHGPGKILVCLDINKLYVL